MLLKGQVASSQIAELYVSMEADNPLKKRLTGCLHGGRQSLEEADNRMVLHIKVSLRILKINKIVVRTVDSDVVVILVSFYPQFLLVDEEIQLIVDFGVSNNRRFINIQDIYETGCDSTAFFFKKSKMVLFKSWMSSSCVNELTAAFRLLSWLPTECIIQSCLPVVNNFIKSVFSGNGKSKQFKTLGDLRYQMFKASTNSNFRELPPTEQSLELHLRRSCYRSGWVWGNTTCQEPAPRVENFGWIVRTDKLLIKWIAQPTDPTILERLIRTCKCKPIEADKLADKKCKTCSRGKTGIPCLDQCNCQRSCVSGAK